MTRNEVALYLRKSRKDTEMETTGVDTLERHEKILRDLAARQQLQIGEIYREIVSGDSIEARPEMQRLLSDVHRGLWRGVLVVEVERLARGDTKDQGMVAEAFKYSETLIITPTKTYDPNNEFDEEYFEFGLFMSRREYKTIKRRLQAGIQLSVMEGNYLGPVPPYGYRILNRGRRDRTLEPTEKALIVELIFRWYGLEELSLFEIVTRLTAMGEPSSKGTSWTTSSVVKILKNDVYIGKVHHGTSREVKEYDAETGTLIQRTRKADDPIIADGKHEPIVSQETWDAVQRRLSNAPKIKKGTELHNMFAGLVRCSKCGHTLAYKCTISYGKKYPQLRHKRDLATCTCSSAPYGDIIEAVSHSIEEAILDFKVKLAAGESDPGREQAALLAEMEKNLLILQEKRKKILIFFEDDLYTESEFLERKGDITRQITALEQEIAATKASTPAAIDYAEKIAKFSACLDAIHNDNISPKDKNRFLKGILTRIDYTRESREVPFTLEVSLVL